MAGNDAWEDVTARVKEQADIVQIIGEVVDLRKAGARLQGLCPFHGEKTPSFSVTPDKQYFHCFGCGESGDVFSFMMKYHNLDFPGALKELARRYNIELPQRGRDKEQEERSRRRAALFAVNEKAATIFQDFLYRHPAAGIARDYLNKRGVGRELAESFRLGYAPAEDRGGWNFLGSKLNPTETEAAVQTGLLAAKERGGTYDRFRDRVLFPIADLSGRICGFGGRLVGPAESSKPKYYNSVESEVYNKSGLLLGLYQQKDEIRRAGRAIIVEGNFDLISLVGHGVTNVVAPLGTALTREQLRLLKRFAGNITLLFDGDAAGVKAAVRSVPHFLAEQLAGSVALLPEGHDPDTYVREYGADAVRELVENGAPLPEFVFDRWVDEYGLTFDGKAKIVEGLQDLVGAASSSLLRTLFLAHFSGKLGLNRADLDQMMAESDKRPVRSGQPSRPERASSEMGPVPDSGDYAEYADYEGYGGYGEDGFAHEPPPDAYDAGMSGLSVPGESVAADLGPFDYHEPARMNQNPGRTGRTGRAGRTGRTGRSVHSSVSSAGALNLAQRRLVNALVLQPWNFARFDEAGIRACLAGSVGESIYLHCRELVAGNEEAEPEDLLALLNSESERALVSDMLLGAEGSSMLYGESVGKQELDDVLEYLQKSQLQRRTEELVREIGDAEQRGDFQTLERLLLEKINLTNILKQ